MDKVFRNDCKKLIFFVYVLLPSCRHSKRYNSRPARFQASGTQVCSPSPLPPREKTRTLMIDRMWVHGTLHPYLTFGCLDSIAGKTRFAQAGAELSMTHRTGDPSSPNYAHCRRPENCEEEDQLGSEGEDVGVLKGRSVARNNEEDERLRRQDLALARSLRLRAERLEKGVTTTPSNPSDQ